jgi:D-alanyl-D-alanine carboxypeptidase
MFRQAFVWGFCAAIAAPFPANASWTAANDTAATQYLNSLVPGTTPTISVCLTIDGAPTFARSAGQIAPGIAAQPNMIYRIGSLSKLFTATGILKLVQDGFDRPMTNSKFSLDDSPSLYLPANQWSVGNPNLTVRRLLNMQSGIPSYTNQTPPGLNPSLPVDAGALLNGIAAFTPSTTPMAYQYSNTNYFLLASIIDNVYWVKPRGKVHVLTDLTGHIRPGYRTFLNNWLFWDAGLTQTNFIDDPAPLGTMVPPDPNGTNTAFSNPSWPKGAGAVQSSVTDLCKWDSALLEGKMLNAASLATMATNGPLVAPASGNTPATYYTMGWFKRQYPGFVQYYHNGVISGYQSENMIDTFVDAAGKPHFVAAVALTNSNTIGNLYNVVDALARQGMKP